MASESVCSGSNASGQDVHIHCLSDLDEVVLTHILARLYDPLPLALTCKALLHALNTQPCKQEWFKRWFEKKRFAEQPVALAVLGWKPLAGYSIAQLSQFCLNVVQDSPALRAQHAGALQEALRLSRSQRWVDVLRMFVPWPEHMFLVTTAASPHSALLQQLLIMEDQASSSHARGTQPGQQRCTFGDEASPNSPAQPPASHSTINPFSHQQGTQPTASLPEPKQQKQLQRQRARQLLLRRPLPANLHNHKASHDLLQSAVLAAAAAGQEQILHLLLQRLLQITMQYCSYDQKLVHQIMDLMRGAVEAAAAAGGLACFEIAVTHCLELDELRHSWQLSSLDEQQRHNLWQQQCIGTLQALQLQELFQGQQYPKQPRLNTAAADCAMNYTVDHLPTQQWVSRLCQQLQNWPGSTTASSSSSSNGDAKHAAAQAAAHVNQFIQYHRAAHLDGVQSIISLYSLIAACRSGSITVVAAALVTSRSNIIRPQLPAALSAAGQRGHLDVLLLLLQQPEVSSKPLELAAADAAVHCWPTATVDALLQHMATCYRHELLQLLHKPLLKALQSSSIVRLQQQQQQQRYAADAMFRVLVYEAVIDPPELLGDVLLVLAQQGESSKVSWVLRVAPSLLVRVGAAAAAAALEGGYPQVAQIIMDAGGERPAAFRAAAKRGELTAAVRNKDIPAVRAILTECSLPLVWTCESIINAAEARIAALSRFRTPGINTGPTPERPAPCKLSCLVNLLKTAAAGGAPESIELLSPLLEALASTNDSSNIGILSEVADFCWKQGLTQELQLVLSSSQGSSNTLSTGYRSTLLETVSHRLQLPDDRLIYDRRHHRGSIDDHDLADHQNTETSESEVPAALSAAICLMQQAKAKDVVSRFVSLPYVSSSVPGSYLNVQARPAFPSMYIGCKKGLIQLLYELSKMDECPVGAFVHDILMYRQMVHVVFEANDTTLLHAFLRFMEVHGESVLADLTAGVLHRPWSDLLAGLGGESD